MGKKAALWLEKWGYALLCVLCAGVILISALWTRSAQREESLSAPSNQSMDETLSDALSREERAISAFSRPCAGAVIRAYSETAVYFDAGGVWSVHPSVDVQADEGTEIGAMWAGTVLETGGNEVIVDHGHLVCTYRGIGTVLCEAGQTLSSGDAVGLAGGHVPFEGAGHVCITLQNEAGAYVDAARYLET